MPEGGVSRDDLRAAVASGLLDEIQAARLIALSDQRQGYRANMVGDDEPFELFRGFSEIFVTVGIGLLMTGFIVGMAALEDGAILAPIVALIAAWLLSVYFTTRRRMVLPSIALCLFYATSFAFLVTSVVFGGDGNGPLAALIIGCAGLVAMLVHFRFFRLPFSMFAAGVFALTAILGLSGFLTGSDGTMNGTIWEWFFDIRTNPQTALATLAFGVLAFLVAMHFDLKDPHRVSRFSSTAFWLHILAAPALVNTIVLTTYKLPGTLGVVLTLLGVGIFAVLALIIDRRSFLTAGLIYLGAIIIDALQSASTSTWADVLTFLLLGAAVTTLGSFWAQVRAWLMNALPDFPKKESLPPYGTGLSVEE